MAANRSVGFLQSRLDLKGKTCLLRVVVDVDRKPAEVVTVTRSSTIARSLEEPAMKAAYDAKTDTPGIILKADARVAEVDEGKPGVSLDTDGQGAIISCPT